jgi:hypothetical protein
MGLSEAGASKYDSKSENSKKRKEASCQIKQQLENALSRWSKVRPRKFPRAT